MKHKEKFIPIKDADKIDESAEQKNGTQVEMKLSEAEEELLNQIADQIAKISELEKERNEFKDQAVRIAAEMDNFRRRTITEKNDLVDYGNQRLLSNMLPLLDDLETAVAHGRQSNDYEALLTGFDLILQKTVKTFAEAGVQPLEDASGKPFDVNLHEALMVMPSDMPEGTVVQIVQQGYMFKDKVLRHAKVITSSGPAKE